MTPRGHQREQTDKSAEARSSAVEKVEKAEAKKGNAPGKGVGQRLHEAIRENA